MRAALLTLVVVWMVVARMLNEYSLTKGDGGKVRGLDFTMVSEMDIPKELHGVITEKKAQPFRLTYSDGENLYIVVGCGPQSAGGCSAVVKELYLTDNSIMIDTGLVGPAKGENPAAETSCLHAVVEMGYLKDPVVF